VDRPRDGDDAVNVAGGHRDVVVSGSGHALADDGRPAVLLERVREGPRADPVAVLVTM
jgi:hypothetical protein